MGRVRLESCGSKRMRLLQRGHIACSRSCLLPSKGKAAIACDVRVCSVFTMQAWGSLVKEVSDPSLETVCAVAVALTCLCSLRLTLEKGGRTDLGSDSKPSGGLLTYIVTHHRWIVCIFGLLPLCFLYETWVSVMDLWADFLRWYDNKGHEDKVKQVCEQVRAWHSGSRERPMVTARPGWKTMSLRIGLYKKTHTAINLGALDSVVGISEDCKSVMVEPLCTIGRLTRFLSKRNVTLPVVPELDDLTIGGMLAGVGVESSSHQHGLFQNIVESIDVIIADGSVLTCDRHQNSDLFHSFPWSHGTVGFLAQARLRIVPSTPYIRLEYIPCKNRKQACKMIQEASLDSSKSGADFVEGLAYSPTDFVVMLGYYAADVPADGVVNRIGRWYKPWFYLHVKEFLTSMNNGTEYIPLRDYYHRHTKSLFWEMQDIIPFGNHPVFRYALGWMMPPSPKVLKVTQTEELRQLYEKFHVVQDMLVPIHTLEESLKVFDEQFMVYPIWLCPCAIFEDRGAGKGGIVTPKPASQPMYIDIGGYGVPKVKNFDAKRCCRCATWRLPARLCWFWTCFCIPPCNVLRFPRHSSCRAVEAHVIKVKGYQMLYADTYLTKDEFYQMFDHTLYNKVCP